MKNKMKLILIGALCMFTLSCGGGKGAQSGAVVFESEDKKVKVYESELNSELQRNLDQRGILLKDVPKDQLEALKIQIIQNIALNRAVALEGKNQKLDSKDTYKNSLETTKDGLLASITVTEKLNKIEVKDEEAKTYYDVNQASFTRPEDTFKLQIISLPAADKAKAEAALKEAKAAPDKFGDLVKKYTPNAQGNGEIQETALSKLGPIGAVVKPLSNGQVGDKVIQAGELVYVVKVLEKNPAGLVPYDKVKEIAKSQIKATKRQAENQKYVNEIAQNYKVDKITKESVKLPATK